MIRPGIVTNVAAMGGLLNPLQIMGANLVAWWNADSAAKITTTGSGVSSWLDEIGNYDLAQATDADRPVWSATSFNGRGGVTADGSSDYLRVATQPASFPTGSDTSEIWMIVDQTVLAADTATKDMAAYGGNAAAGNSRRVRRVVSSGTNRAQITANGTTTTEGTVDFSGRKYIRAAFVNGAHHIDVNGTASGNGAVSLNTDTQYFTLFANHAVTAAGFWGGVVHQAFVLNASPSAGQLASLNAYCAARL